MRYWSTNPWSSGPNFASPYSVYVTPAGGAEQVVGLNFAFRTEQSTVGSLSNYGLRTDSATGSVRLCNFRLGTDRFGIAKLNPTVPGGREWFSKWDNGHARSIPFGPDSDDPEFHARGQASAGGGGLIPCAAGGDPAQILTGPNLSVLMRNDSATDVRYKKWSIREIAAQ